MQRLVFLGLVVVGLALGGCGGMLQPPGPPVAIIYATSDGFHSSVIVPFDPARGRLAPKGSRYAQFSFGEYRWMVEGRTGFWRMLRIGLWPSRGVIILTDVPPDMQNLVKESQKNGLKAWRFNVDARGWQSLVNRLNRWVDWDQRRTVGLYVVHPSRRRFTVFNNCNDFVAELLKAAGVPIGPRLVRTAGVLSRQIVRGLGKLRQRGPMIDKIGNILAPKGPRRVAGGERSEPPDQDRRKQEFR